MDYVESTGDVFAIPNLWGPSQLTRNLEHDSSFLFAQLHFEGRQPYGALCFFGR